MGRITSAHAPKPSTGLTTRQIHRQNTENLFGKGWLDKLPSDFSHKKNDKPGENESVDVSMLDSPRICKSFLVGKCIYEELENTKENLGKCSKLHVSKYKIIYETAKEKGIPMPNNNYELDYLNELKRIVKNCDERVRIAYKRLDYSENDKMILSKLENKIDDLNNKVRIAKLELEFFNGDIHRRIEINKLLSEYINELKICLQTYSATLERLNNMGHQKIQVCEVCGAYMSKIDNDKRLVDHFIGKIHLTYADIRRSLKELEEKYVST